MTVLKTPADLGDVIRQRRKALGWDQARLAYETGVSRQWVIDIEKGKPRAELQLVLRVMNALGVPLTAALHAPSPDAASGAPRVDINAIVDRHRLPLQGRPRTARTTGTLSYADILEQARRELPSAGAAPLAVHEPLTDYPAKPRKGT